MSKRKRASVAKERLGHGNHWEALGIADPEELILFARNVVQRAQTFYSYSPPWPDAPFCELIMMEQKNKELPLAAIVGRRKPNAPLSFLSAFPILSKTAEWIVQVDEVSDDYGAVEGLVIGHAASGHSLQWFAPHFGREAAEWRRLGLMRVDLAALALKVAPFKAEPIVVSEGPLVEERRESLRAEGKLKAAASPTLTVKVITKTLRTVYSSSHDHHEFVGKIQSVREINAPPAGMGWRLELECYGDHHEVGWRLPMYVFPAALRGGESPKRGDLIQGFAWLQGTWKGHASAVDQAKWHRAEGAPPANT